VFSLSYNGFGDAYFFILDWTRVYQSFKIILPEKLKRKKIKIAILFGGRSAEHEVSLTSACAIYNNLDKDKYKIVCLYINRQGLWKKVKSPQHSLSTLNKGQFSSFLPWAKNPLEQALEADIYFPILHGPYGEDGTIQGFLEMADVPYVGAGVLASALGMDKAIAKVLFQARQLPLVKYMVVYDSDWKKESKTILAKIEKEFSLPFFVKPAKLGSSVGITKVNSSTQMEAAIKEAFRYDRKILIEEGIIGREIECSVLGNDEPQASLPGEIIPFRDFYDYQDKYVEGKTSFAIPAKLPSSMVDKIQKISIEAYRAIDCAGMARVDFFIEKKTERIILNEINTIPGFTEISMYPKLWEVSGLSFSRLLDRLIELGFDYHQKKKNLRKTFQL